MERCLRLFACFVVVAGTRGAGARGEYKWSVSGPILSPGTKGSFDEVAVKDPSIVFFDGKWHMFYTARSTTEYTTGYVCARKLADLQSAPRYELPMIRGQSRYGCAPQIFYYGPQHKWYLIFQNRDSNYQPSFSTTTEIANPQSWSKPKSLLQKDSPGKWIDFWVICDQESAYLFYTEAHDRVMVRSTSRTSFPNDWSRGVEVLRNVHEAVHVYKPKSHDEFHMFYELSDNGVRSFGLATSPRLAGPWKKVSDHYATSDNFINGGKAADWTEMVSHGEALRVGYNEQLEYDPEGCVWLIQGMLKQNPSLPYESLRWKIGLMSKVQ